MTSSTVSNSFLDRRKVTAEYVFLIYFILSCSSADFLFSLCQAVYFSSLLEVYVAVAHLLTGVPPVKSKRNHTDRENENFKPLSLFEMCI